jgi:hypothetical protein
MSFQSSTTGPADRYRTSRDAAEIPYLVTRGDDLIQNKILTPDTVREIMDRLAYVGGDLAYTPEMQAKIMEVLTMRYETNMGNDLFMLPNYAPYEDPEIAAFYGVDTTQTNNIQTRKETFQEQKDRIINETVREVEVEFSGLQQMMEHFRREDWARHGVADESPYIHSDPDITLLRNPSRGWCPLDLPISTSDHSNVIDLTEGEPEFTFPTPHPGWDVDRPHGFWNSLS